MFGGAASKAGGVLRVCAWDYVTDTIVFIKTIKITLFLD